MRPHAKRFGFEDLEEHVYHFDIPELLPGFAFFNIEPALANGVPRQQAIKDRVDHYVEVLKMTMGAERYEQAVVSPNLLKYLIRLMYDAEHGLQPRPLPRVGGLLRAITARAGGRPALRGRPATGRAGGGTTIQQRGGHLEDSPAPNGRPTDVREHHGRG